MIKHEIIIIVYNQELTIRQALYSAINQTIKPYKISIFDDCSKDQTVEVIEGMIQTITGCNIEIHRNQMNLGIFPNFNQALQSATGDIVHILAGDDELELSLLENYNRYITFNQIDIKKPIWMIPNITEFYQDGKSKQINQYLYHNKSIFESILANRIRSFELGLSLPAGKQSIIETNIGYQADNLKSLLLCKKIDVRLVDFYGYRYRVFTGVTTNTNQIDIYNSRVYILKLLLNEYGNILTAREKKMVRYELATVNYILTPNILTYLRQIQYVILILIIHHTVLDKKVFVKQLLPISWKNIIKSILRIR